MGWGEAFRGYLGQPMKNFKNSLEKIEFQGIILSLF
jgi:hypothetical protein